MCKLLCRVKKIEQIFHVAGFVAEQLQLVPLSCGREGMMSREEEEALCSAATLLVVTLQRKQGKNLFKYLKSDLCAGSLWGV